MLVGVTWSQDLVEGDRVKMSVRLGSEPEVRWGAWMCIQRRGEEIKDESTTALRAVWEAGGLDVWMYETV